jgi:hypothetical protein
VYVSFRSEQLAKPAVVIEMLMREDHNVDRRIVQIQRIEVSPKCSGIRTAVDDHLARPIPDVDSVPLSDVEHANDQLSAAGIGDETRYWRFGRLTLRLDRRRQRCQCKKKENGMPTHLDHDLP